MDYIQDTQNLVRGLVLNGTRDKMSHESGCGEEMNVRKDI